MANWLFIVVATICFQLEAKIWAQSFHDAPENTSFLDKMKELSDILKDKVNHFRGNATSMKEKIADEIKKKLNVTSELMAQIKDKFDNINDKFYSNVRNVLHLVKSTPSQVKKRFEGLKHQFVQEIKGLFEVGHRFTDVFEEEGSVELYGNTDATADWD